ncbi:class I SAM-dependent methyltransferase [Ktedonosporobacter rubrisoli]|uniref:Class I SAM-dependent methyltransferase n=1 Tax=Ktedonosporobacter rubrisoli TaxID=2509675 RepID=A0A4P6K4B3_KTERU|nr:class I SAM-dependent methyltransferase [Ktedonosporobacter rubrisoli]QBD83147.1 class I SAM-dependent methyltransferase [Ktedonosporobacter rubrisoli]
MAQSPEQMAAEYRGYAEAFKDQSVVEAYRYRHAYPGELFSILDELAGAQRAKVLDVGCGRGDIARNLVALVERVDAVDVSLQMIQKGKQLPNGDHPRLHWLHGRIEEVELDPPYTLITAGDSIHWLDWSLIMPRFQQILAKGGYLALVERWAEPDPWSILSELLPHYRTDKYYAQQLGLEKQNLFQKVGERKTSAEAFAQSIDDYIESYHSRVGFSRERMGQERAAAFDREARKLLQQAYRTGTITFQVGARVIWGFPQKP